MNRTILAVFAVALVAASEGWAFALERASTPSFWIFVLGGFGVAGALAALDLHRSGDLARLFRPVGGDFTKGFLIAAGLYVAAAFFRKTALPAGGPFDGWLVRVYLQLGDPRALRTHVALYGAALVALAVAQELVFRGLVLSVLEPRLGSRRAWIAAAFVYAAAQLPTVLLLRDGHAGPNPLLVLMALTAGLAWGALVASTRRLLPAVVSHALFAWATVIGFPLWGNTL